MSIIDYTQRFNMVEESFTSIYEYAKREKVPIIDNDALNVLKHFIRITNAKTILEIGTAIGYSALHMIDVRDDIKVVTVEKDHHSFEIAMKNFEQFDKSNRIECIHTDAKLFSVDMAKTKEFDMLFIDASKGNNQLFFEKFAKYVKNDGIIIVDNYYARGIVESDDITHKNTRKLKEKVDSFNQWIYHSVYHTSFLPVGDGLIIISKDKGEKE